MLFIYLLIFSNIAIFLLINTGRLDSSDYSLSYYEVSVRKDYKRLITSAFIHENLLHLAMNMMALYNIGNVLSYFLNTFLIIIAYFVSIVVGHLLSINMRHNNNDDYTSSIGASGGICGLIGVYFVILFLFARGSAISSILRSLLSIVLISVVPGVDGKSHICCLAVGIVLGFILFLL